jgi:hypothetical protein
MGKKCFVDKTEYTDRKSGRKRTLAIPRRRRKCNVAMELK